MIVSTKFKVEIELEALIYCSIVYVERLLIFVGAIEDHNRELLSSGRQIIIQSGQLIHYHQKSGLFLVSYLHDHQMKTGLLIDLLRR